MKLRQIISGALAFAITANSMSFLNFSLSASAETREEWKGYEDVVAYDTWDGTYDTSWFTENAGTKEDPYIIDSAEAFMGIQKKAITANAADKNQATASSSLNISDLNYFSEGTKYALPKNASVRDKNSWYSFAWATPFTYSYNFTYTYDTQDIVAGVTEYKHYFITQVLLNVTINDINKTIDITDIARQSAPALEHDTLFNPLEEDVFISEDMVTSSGYNDFLRIYPSVSELDGIFKSVMSDWEWYAPVSEDKIYMYQKSNVNEYNIEENGEQYILVGTTSEFDIEFPELTATNLAGEAVVINIFNKDKYYLGISAGYTSTSSSLSSIATETSITDTISSLPLYLKGSSLTNASVYFSDTTLDDEKTNGTYSTYTTVKDMALTDIELAHREYGTGNNYHYYWQDSNSTERFDKDPHYYYVKGTDVTGYNDVPYYTYSCDVTLSTNTITMDMSCKDRYGNIVKTWTNTQNFTAGSYTLYNSFYMRVTMATNGTITFEPYLSLARFYNNKYYTSRMSLSKFTDSTPSDAVITLDDADDFIVTDENGNTYNYSDIASEITFAGKSTAYPYTHESVVARNIYLEDTLPSLVADNENTNPTFEGKYFKLTTDISIEEVVEPVFPYCASGELGTAGLGGDFDMNGHIISTKSSLFGNITETGKLHNGLFTTQERVVYGIVADNYGTVDNISYIPYNAFNGTGTFVGRQALVWSNFGVMSDIDIVSGDNAAICSNNLGTIKKLDILYTVGGQNIGYVINANHGILQNVTVDTDRDSFVPVGQLLPVLQYNDGIVDNFEVKDFSVESNSYSYYFPIQYTCENTLFKNVTYAYSNRIEGKYTSILPQTNGACYNICFENLKITGYHTCASVTQIGSYNSRMYNIKFVNADIDITVKDTSNTWNELIAGSFIDSKISIVGENEATDSCDYLMFCNFINTDVYLSDCFGGYYTSSVIWRGIVQDSYIHIGKITNEYVFQGGSYYKDGSYVRDSIFEIDEAVYTTKLRGYLVWSYYCNSLCCYNSDFIFNSVSGYMPYNVGGYLKDCRVWIEYANELNAGSSTNDVIGTYEDCEFYYTFDETANGNITGILQGTRAVSDTFVYVDEMPDAVSVNDRNLTGLGSCINNVTIIAPKVNVNSDIEDFCISGVPTLGYFKSPWTSPLKGLNIITNVYTSEGSKLESVSAFCGYDYTAYKTIPQMYPIIHSLNASLNVYDENGNNADIPTYAITLYNGWFCDSRINNVVFRSNTLSPYSALYGVNGSAIKDLIYGSRAYPLFWNCYMDLPNVKTDGIPSTDADYATAGFFGAFTGFENYDYIENYDAYATAAHYTNTVHYSRCYIPEDQNAVSTYFTSDSSVMDSWSITDSWLSTNLNSQYGTWVAGEHFDFESETEGINEISADADKNGELAYMLDKGYAGVRRTYNWSVIEPDTVVYNSFNNEPLYTLPTITWSATHAIPDRCFAEDTNLKPVFKTTVTEAQDGYIKAVGIGGSKTTNGNIYVKQGAYVVEEAKPTADEVALIYATQKLGDAVPVKIPNTPRASAYSLRARSADNGYDITGYTQQGIDTVLTPVFKTARYISVDIENSENGTVIPSAYVSAEGEKITVSIQSETGYIVNNIKINGQSLTESFFFMPDEDVLITGECVPFEGGITSFSLFGIAGEIDQIAKTITVNVPKSQYVNNALPVIEYYGDYIVPSVSTRTDFTSPVDYTVYYGDNQSVTYKVTVNQSEYTMKIYDFVINGVHGKIDQANRTISIGLPAETDLRNLVPEDIAYSAESISPAVNEARDFTVDQIYTLYTTGMIPVSYVVNVYSADENTAKLTKFVVSGYEGVIDEETLTVTLTVPEGLDLTNVVPDLIEYEGKKISPSKVTAVNLNDAEYDITSQSGVVNTYTINVDYISDDEAHIDKFVLGGVEGVIDEDDKTITVTISKSVNITGIAPDVIEYTGKSIYPSDDEEQDFTLPITYTVVAPDNTEVSYEIVVEYLENKADLLEFAILGYEGVIDQDEKTVAVTIPYGIDVTDTPPSKLIVSANANVTPTIVERQDFIKPVIYTVTSQDKLVTNDYTINVTIEKPSTIAEITEFKIDEYEGEIDQEEGTITVILPYDYPTEELEDKVPEIVWSGESITPNENEAQDFTKPVEYIVKAEAPDVSKDYDIIVKYEDSPYVPNKIAEITEFKIDEYEGEIDPEKGTITVTLPYDYPEEELENKVPEIEWVGEDIEPDDNKAQDFTEPVKYTVTAEDPTVTKDYDIVIKYEDPDKTAKITEFKIDEYEGEIDDEEGAITVTLPYDYPQEELEDKIPEIKWTGKDIDPDDNVPQDFTKPVTYKVTAQDPTIVKEYDIVIEYEEPNTDAKIIEFYIDSYKGEIDQDKGIITVTVPYNYPNSELENKVPSIIWVGKDITPDEDEAQDFTEDIKYTVTAQDPSVKKDYDIVVKHTEKPVTPVIPTIPEKDKEAKIIEFYIDEHKAEIDQDKGIITITLPADYPEEELKNKVPEIIWVGEDIEPDENKAQDFTKPLSYTVTAEDPTISKKYDIIVEFAPEQTPDVEEIPEEDDSTEEEEEETPSEDPVEENDPVEEDKVPEDDEEIPEEDNEEIEEDDGPVPTGIALSFVPFIVSAVTVVVSGKMGKKNTKDDK